MIIKKQNISLLSALILSATLSSCALTQAPPQETPLITIEEVQKRYQVDEKWWERYGDSELNAIVNQALENNIDLKKSLITVQKALYTLRQSDADLLPTLDGSVSGSVSRDFRDEENSESYSAGLNLSYELDLWNRLGAASEANLREFQATNQDLRAARLTLINSVVDAWFQLAYLDQSIAIMKKNVERYEELFQIFKDQYEAGKTASISMVQARQSLLSAKSSLSDLQNSRASTEQTLGDLLNIRPADAPTYSPIAITTLEPVPVDLAIPLAVLSGRPDLLAAEERLQEAWYSQTEQKRSWYPSITLGASLSSSSETFGKVFNFPVGTGSLSVNLPFLEWNKMKWQDKTAEANFADAQLDFEKALTTALNEVQSYYTKYSFAKKTLARDTETYALNQQNSRYYEERYKTGANELSDYLDALNTEFTTKQQIVNDRYEVLKYENLIYGAMGGRFKEK